MLSNVEPRGDNLSSTQATEQLMRAWYLAERRDVLLLLLLGVGILVWTWERSPLLMLGGGLFAVFLFWLMLNLQKEGVHILHRARQELKNQEAFAKVQPFFLWSTWLLIPAALITILLLSRATFISFGSVMLAGMVAFLSGSWQLWLYFWHTTPTEGLEDK